MWVLWRDLGEGAGASLGVEKAGGVGKGLSGRRRMGWRSVGMMGLFRRLFGWCWYCC